MPKIMIERPNGTVEPIYNIIKVILNNDEVIIEDKFGKQTVLSKGTTVYKPLMCIDTKEIIL